MAADLLPALAAIGRAVMHEIDNRVAALAAGAKPRCRRVPNDRVGPDGFDVLQVDAHWMHRECP
jgi:hypothetical protein